MYKFKRSQILLSVILASLLIITPLLSSSLRPTYLYFIINLLIIALGAESGLLSSLLSNPNPSPSPSPIPDDRKQHAAPTPPPSGPTSIEGRDASCADKDNAVTQEVRPNKVVEKCNSEKIASVAGGLRVITAEVEKCPSTPSIFFIGDGDTQSPRAAREESKGEEEEEEEEEVVVVADTSSQELFTKAENFIGNFYRQLKMQREESWKKIHGFYQRAF